MFPVGVKAWVAGSYISAKAIGFDELEATPPTIRTLPFPRSVAVCPERGDAMFPVEVNLPIAGS
jgi:hypothetical protein